MDEKKIYNHVINLSGDETGAAETPEFAPSRQKTKIIYLASAVVILILLAAAAALFIFYNPLGKYISGDKPVERGMKDPVALVLADDWLYDAKDAESRSMRGMPTASSPDFGMSLDAAPALSENIGLAAGGAKDADNFRQNIENDYLPLPTDISYEGLFYDYYFETGQSEECRKLFCPSYATAVAADPISGEAEYYLSAGLNSGIKEADFKRKKLNLAVVLDISGSMSSPFSRYYYDRAGGEPANARGEDADRTKMEIAAQAVAALLDRLEDDDRFGMVLFESVAHLAKPMNPVKETDMAAIKNHVLEIRERGGTNMAAGMKMAAELFAPYIGGDSGEYENRIIFLTDAMPNRDETSAEGLFGLARQNAENGVYATFIGIGVDFNTELTDAITKIKGANYYAVHSAEDFKRRLADEFEYMVTPLVFDLKLTLAGSGFAIEKVYGSPEADEATGEIMKVNTLFPSKIKNGETRGGLILLKLKKTGDEPRLVLSASYLDREGKPDSDEAVIDFTDEPHYRTSGVRKGVALARWADLIKNWIIDERKDKSVAPPEPVPPDYYAVNERDGLTVPGPIDPALGQWERQSLPLAVNAHYGEIFKRFLGYFSAEAASLADPALDREKAMMEKLIALAGKANDAGVSSE